MMSVKTVLVATFVFFLASIPRVATSTEWFVDASVETSGDGMSPETAFKTIKEAINAAGDGDTVRVAPGRHAESLLVRGLLEESLSLVGSGPDVTTIDAGGGPCPVSFVGMRYEWLDVKPPPWETQPKPSFRIEGFTITNSANDAVGAIYCSNGNITIKDCKLTGNSSTFGAGIFLDECSAVISGCELSGNSAEQGGGLYVWASEVVVTDCFISENTASEGGGISCWYSRPQVVRTVLSKNASGKGGALLCEESPAILVNCTVVGNSASEGAGGIHCHEPAPRQSLPLIMNSILWGNGMTFSGRLGPEMSFSDIEDPSFSGLDGNISAPPMFVDAAAGDYNLVSGSPCIDMGNPDPVYNDEDASRCDMGAFGGTGNTSDIGVHARIAHVAIESEPSGPKRAVIYWLADPSASFVIQWKDDMLDAWPSGVNVEADETWLNRWVDTFATEVSKRLFYRVGTIE